MLNSVVPPQITPWSAHLRLAGLLKKILNTEILQALGDQNEFFNIHGKQSILSALGLSGMS